MFTLNVDPNADADANADAKISKWPDFNLENSIKLIWSNKNMSNFAASLPSSFDLISLIKLIWPWIRSIR